MKKSILKKFICLILCGFLCVGTVTSNYYKTYALEWAGIAVGVDTALKFLLGLVGVTVGVGLASETDWNTLYDDAVDAQVQAGNSQVEVSKWWADVLAGSIDTASDCWTSFKSWLHSFVNGDLVVTHSSVSALLSTIFSDLSGLGDYSEYDVTYAYYTVSTYNRIMEVIFLTGSYELQFVVHNRSLGFHYPSPYADVTNGSFTRLKFHTDVNGNLNTTPIINTYTDTWSSWESYSPASSIYVFGNLTLPSSDTFAINEWILSGGSLADEGLTAVNNDIANIGLLPVTATDVPYDGVINIPWEDIGADSEAISEAIDELLEQVNDGTITPEQYWTNVQEITNVYAYDITNNYLLPENGSDETTESITQPNVSNVGFTLGGLENVFPFCIPWDIYAFMTILVASPKAPEFDFPIYNPTNNTSYNIHVDMSEWHDVVVLFRYIFDFLFIVGLALLARRLIGAGGD